MPRYSTTRASSRGIRFFDLAVDGGKFVQQTIEEAMNSEQKAYTVLNNAVTSTVKTVNVVTGSASVSASLTWVSTSLATIPDGFPTQSKNDFTIFINGVAVENDAVHSVTGSGVNVVVTFSSSLNYSIDSTDEYMLTGKANA